MRVYRARQLPQIGAFVGLLCCVAVLSACGRVEQGDGHRGVDSQAGGAGPGVTSGGSGAGLGVSGSGADVPESVREGLTRLVNASCAAEACGADLDFELSRVAAGIEAGRLSIDLDVLESCLAEPVDTYIFDSRAVSGYGVDEPCAGLFVPLSPVGAPCDTDFACIDGFCLRDDFSRSRPHYVIGSCGVCAPRGQAGDSCSGRSWVGGDAECAEGLICHCEITSDGCVEGICEPPPIAALGQPCDSQISCAEGLACVYRDSAGTCEVPKSTGERCETAGQCASDICLDQDEQGWGKCGPRLPGSVCADSAECEPTRYCADDGECTLAVLGTPCYYECSDDSVCVWGPDFDPLCRPRVARGETCIETEQCPEHNLCIDGTCGQYLAVGDACSAPGDPDVCPPGSGCVDGSCQRYPDIGQACAGDCLAGACQNGVCGPLEVGSLCDKNSMHGGADPCGPGLECGGAYSDTGAVCEARPAIGEPCLDGYCDSGAFCTQDGFCSAICLLDIETPPVR